MSALEALQRADEVRLGAASLKREIAALSLTDGLQRVSLLLARGDRRAAVIPVSRLLTSIRAIGDQKMRRLAGSIDPSARVRDLSDTDRLMLSRRLRYYAKHRRIID